MNGISLDEYRKKRDVRSVVERSTSLRTDHGHQSSRDSFLSLSSSIFSRPIRWNSSDLAFPSSLSLVFLLLSNGSPAPSSSYFFHWLPWIFIGCGDPCHTKPAHVCLLSAGKASERLGEPRGKLQCGSPAGGCAGAAQWRRCTSCGQRGSGLATLRRPFPMRLPSGTAKSCRSQRPALATAPDSTSVLRTGRALGNARL